MRAPKCCAEVGCLAPSVNRGRCDQHQRPSWQGSSRTRPPGWAAIRRRVLTAPCAVCGQPSREVDHIVPLSQGGGWEGANLQALCHDCHHAKSQAEAQEARRKRHESGKG